MPRHPDFEKIYQAFKDNEEYSQDPEDPKYFEKMYYAWLNKNKYDDTKPFPGTSQQLKEFLAASTKLNEIRESFEWAVPISPYLQSYERKIRGEAIHAGETKVPLPKQQRNIYTRDELLMAARTLEGMPIKINHGGAKWHEQENVGIILEAEPVDSGEAIEYIGQIYFDDLYDLIRDKTVITGSINATAHKFEVLNGASPKGLHFTEFSLIMAPELPGDPKASVEVWESLHKFFTGTSSQEHVTKQREVERKKVIEMEKTKKPSTATKEAFGDASFPDEAFAYVPDEAKGEEGNKSLRKLPHHNADGSLSEEHVRNALARLDQTEDIPATEKEAIKKHLEAHMKEINPEYEPSESLKEIRAMVEAMQKVNMTALKTIETMQTDIEYLKKFKELTETQLKQTKESQGSQPPQGQAITTISDKKLEEKLTAEETKIVLEEVLKKTPLKEVMQHQ